MRSPPLDDPRRNTCGNRTVRMSLSMWQAARADKGWPHDNPNLKARTFCRTTELTPGYVLGERASRTELVQQLIHGSHWQSTPSLQRKKYAIYIRALLKQMRDNDARRRSRAAPGQNFNRLPGPGYTLC